jgi:hypothetical protein
MGLGGGQKWEPELGERMGEDKRKKRGGRIEEERGQWHIKDKDASLVGTLPMHQSHSTRAPRLMSPS